MKRPTRARTAALIVGAAVVIFAALALPPRQIRLARTFDDGTAAGAIHVHTSRSDGRGTIDDVAAAAARAGLQFVVVTDHGDATRPPEPPTYRHGVLCLDGVEISTASGHYLAFDMPAAPYPLGGEAYAVVEDVKRLGGFGVVAHPDSPKSDLSWREWDAPFDGIEVINPDTSWRQHLYEDGIAPKLRLINSLFTYPFRGQETVAGLLHQSAGALAHWDRLSRHRAVVLLAGVDAHARLGLRSADPGEDTFALPIPDYETLFRSMSVRVAIDRPFAGDAPLDAATLMRALRAGRVYSVTDGLASPPALEFTAANEEGRVAAGGDLTEQGSLTLQVRSNAPPSFVTTVWRGAEMLASDHREQFTVMAPAGPAAYRVDIHAADRPHQPVWIVSNPIYIRGAASSSDAPPPAPAFEPLRSLVDTQLRSSDRWGTETDPRSSATFDASQSALMLDFRLADGAPAGQYAALRLVTADGLLGTADGVTFVARATRPIRLSIQIRTEARWQRSIYLDETERSYLLRFEDFRPIADAGATPPGSADVHSLIWAVDTVNTAPGTAARFWIDQVRTVRIM